MDHREVAYRKAPGKVQERSRKGTGRVDHREVARAEPATPERLLRRALVREVPKNEA